MYHCIKIISSSYICHLVKLEVTLKKTWPIDDNLKKMIMRINNYVIIYYIYKVFTEICIYYIIYSFMDYMTNY